MIKNIHGESEESIKSFMDNELNTYMKKKSKLKRMKSKKVFPSDEEKYEVNIYSLKISPDFSLLKQLVQAIEMDLNLDLLKSQQSDEDSFSIQIDGIKKSFDKNTKHSINKNKDKKLTNSTNSTRKESNSDEISDNGSDKKEKLYDESTQNSPEEQSNVLNLNFLNLNSKHESINIITDRIIHEVYLDLSLNTNPFVDYILYQRQINKMMNKEKEFVPTLVKSLLNSFSLLVKDRVGKLPLYEKFKNQKKDHEGNYLFNSNDYKILIDIHWFYEIIIRLIRQIKEIFEAPLNIFNKICKIEFNFDSLLKEIFYDLVFFKEIACLITYAEYKISTPTLVLQIVKKFSEETTKLMAHTQLKKINELLNPDKKSPYNYFEFMSNLRKSISDSGNEKVSDLKICIDEQENKTKNQVIHVTVEKKEKDVASIVKKNHQYKSIDELYNFIVSNENPLETDNGNKTGIKSEIFQNKIPHSNQIKNKLIKRKINKKKTIPQTQTQIPTPTQVYNFDSNTYKESPQLTEMFMIEDPTVDNFKKILAFQSINANTVNKIKPNLKKEWLSAITY